MKIVIKSLLTVAVFVGLFIALPASHASAAIKDSVCNGVIAAGGACTEAGSGTTVNAIVETIVNVLSMLVGIVAVIMIIAGGFKYITSSGDSGNIQSAKNTIIYALIGLVIAVSAKVITGFVLSKVT